MIEVTIPRFSIDTKLFAPCLLAALELVLALALGTGFATLGADGGAWILGGIGAGAIVFYSYRALGNTTAQPNRQLRKVGQLLIGLAIGFSIQQGNLADLSSAFPVFGLIALSLLISGVAIGYFYSRLEKTDLLTAILATVPGNIGIMASIAADYDRNTSLVSLVQLLRFTAVVFIVPTLTHVSYPHDVGTVLASLGGAGLGFNLSYLVVLTLLLSVTALVVYLGGKLRIPVAAFLCSIAVGLVFSSFWQSLPADVSFDFSLPPILKVVGQILLGTTIGEYWGINPSLNRKTVMRAGIPVVLTFGAGWLSAAIAHSLTGWDWLTCLLVAAPGGSPEMIWIALALHHNVEIVTTGHLVRLLAINFTLPLLVTLGLYLERLPAARAKVAAPSR